jgi:hypothetical protein
LQIAKCLLLYYIAAPKAAPMIKFFQILFFTSGIILIVLNVLEFLKYSDSKKEGSLRPHPIKWFPFILTSLVAIGCVMNILISWIG